MVSLVLWWLQYIVERLGEAWGHFYVFIERWGVGGDVPRGGRSKGGTSFFLVDEVPKDVDGCEAGKVSSWE